MQFLGTPSALYYIEEKQKFNSSVVCTDSLGVWEVLEEQ